MTLLLPATLTILVLAMASPQINPVWFLSKFCWLTHRPTLSLDEDMSREPLGPLTRHGDNNWNDIVTWVVECTINGEFLGVGKDNVDSMLGGDDPVIQNLLGETGDLGQALGLGQRLLLPGSCPGW